MTNARRPLFRTLLLALLIAAPAAMVARDALAQAASGDAPPAPAPSPPPATSGSAGRPTADSVAAKVQTFYNQTTTFQATFQQVYKVKAYNQTKKSNGKVIFAKPGKMSWSYDTPNGNRVVSDGKTLKVYEKDNNQMFEQPVEKSQYPAALAFLMGQGDLTKSFNLKLLDAATLKFEGGYVLEGLPKEATPAYQKVIFFVDGPTSQVRRVIILDAQGNKNTFDFRSPRVNEPVPDETFQFTPPQGTQIIHP
jgi:outer membrane lipoprotein carrier protein